MEDRFLRACRGEETDAVPVWFMRQAGRSLPEYRALRERHSILEMCRTPELAVEVTLQPVRRLGVDAAILFSDIVVVLEGMGVDLDIEAGTGPVIEKPVRTLEDVERLQLLEPEEDVSYVIETVRALRSELGVPLIGFGGAPFTLASYLIEGGPSKTHGRTKAMMLGDAPAWTALMEKLSESVVRYLNAQVAAGAQAIQLFDSWAGHLSDSDYRSHVKPWVDRILDRISDVPKIHFGVGTGELLGAMSERTDVMGIDWRVPLDVGRARAGGKPVQGNLDPALCLAPWEVVESRANDILARGGGAGHIFNLGHGVLPETDPDLLKRLVDHVHAWSPDE